MIYRLIPCMTTFQEKLQDKVQDRSHPEVDSAKICQWPPTEFYKTANAVQWLLLGWVQKTRLYSKPETEIIEIFQFGFTPVVLQYCTTFICPFRAHILTLCTPEPLKTRNSLKEGCIQTREHKGREPFLTCFRRTF